MADTVTGGGTSRNASGHSYMAPELRVERARSRLVLEELTNLFDGGPVMTEMKKKFNQIVASDPVFRQDDYHYNTVEEEFSRSMERSVQYVKYMKELGIEDTTERLMFHQTNPHSLPIGVSEAMFTPTIENQTTDNQKSKWLPRVKSYCIVGAYAQTELGHGTYIRGLETTATYDPSTQEFVLHSPTLTSIKWWPGEMGHTATHAVVVAKLITKGEDHGMHMFIVQLRSLEDHTPLPGVKVGDIGPKFGYKGMDNGFLQLTNVRIPRDQMLMKYSKVFPDGTYTKSKLDKISYATMVFVRAYVVTESPLILSRTVTIAVRYSVVRRQSQNMPGPSPETQVMDYQTQQYKLLPLIATAYAFTFAGQYLMKVYTDTMSKIFRGNIESLQELHATSAGLKALSTEVCSQGMEVCRLACGGHGYSLASGIPTLYADYSPGQTYEGENTVMYLQTARYLRKMFNQQLTQSQLPPNIVYLASDYTKHISCAAHTSEHFSDHKMLVEAYRQRVRRMVEIATTEYQCAKNSGLDDSAAWNVSSVDWTNAAKAHCHFVVLKVFSEIIQNADVCPANLIILNALCSLYAVYGIVQCSGEFTLNGYLSMEQMGMVRSQLYSLLNVVRQEAVPLVDAFDIPDTVLNSALGRYDGDVYRHLYEWALKAPRNKSEVHNVYYKYLKPLIKSML